MKRALLLFSTLVFAISFTTISAQEKRTSVRVKPKDIDNMSRVELQSGDKVFPKSYLYKTNRSSIVVLPGLVEDEKGRPHFMHKEVAFDDIDYVTIYNKKRKVRSSIIGGVVGGVLTYFVVDQLGSKRLRQPSIELLGQAPETRIVEPIALGFVGAGVGVIIGEMLSPLKLSMKEDKREIQKRLKQFSYR